MSTFSTHTRNIVVSTIILFFFISPIFATYYQYWNVGGLVFPREIGDVNPGDQYTFLRVIYNETLFNNSGYLIFRADPSGYLFSVNNFPAVVAEFSLERSLIDSPNGVNYTGDDYFPILQIFHRDSTSIWRMFFKIQIYTNVSTNEVLKVLVSGYAEKIYVNSNGTEIREQMGYWIRSFIFSQPQPAGTKIRVEVAPRFYVSSTLNMSQYYSGGGNTTMANITVGFYYKWSIGPYNESMVFGFPLVGVDNLEKVGYLVDEASGWYVWFGLGWEEYDRLVTARNVIVEEIARIYTLRVWNMIPDVNLLLKDLQQQFQTGQPGDIIQPATNFVRPSTYNLGRIIFYTVVGGAGLFGPYMLLSAVRKEESDISIIVGILITAIFAFMLGILGISLFIAIIIALAYTVLLKD